MSSRAYHYVVADDCPKWIEQRVAPYVFSIKGDEDDFRLRKITSIFVFLFIAIALCAVFLTIVAIAFCIHKAGGILAVDNKTIGSLLVFVAIFVIIAALYRLCVSKSIMKENALYSPLVLQVSLFDVYFVQEDDSGFATFMTPSGEIVKVVSPNGEVSEKIDTFTAGTFDFRNDIHIRFYINDILDEWKANRKVESADSNFSESPAEGDNSNDASNSDSITVENSIVESDK